MNGLFLHFQKAAQRLLNLGYCLQHPGYRRIRRLGGNRDLFRLLNKPWFFNLQVQTVLDVGANEGQSIVVFRELLPQARIFAFEPNPEMVQALETRFAGAPDIRIVPVGCGSAAGQMSLHVSKLVAASSFLPATPKHLQEFPGTEECAAISVRVDRLDSISQRRGFEGGIAIKLDVQGTELEVLKGAEGILDRVRAVVCEINFASLFENQGHLDEVVHFLRLHGFQLADMGQPQRSGSSGQALFADFAFVQAQAGYV